jgi:hypothetical protein
MAEQCAEKCFIRRADCVKRPQRTELNHHVGLLLEQLAQLLFRDVESAASRGARGEFEPRLTGEPFVRVRVQFHQIALAEFRKVANFDSLRFAVSEFIDAAAGTMDAGAFVTFAGIAPIENEHAAIGAVTEFHAAKPGIAREEKVGAVPPNVTGTVAFEDFLICATTMQV